MIIYGTSTKLKHDCHLQYYEEDLLLTQIPGNSLLSRCRRRFRRYCTVSTNNPKTILFFKSTAAIAQERNRHAKHFGGTIHPYSEFRMHWQWLMGVVLLLQLILIPVHCAFETFNTFEAGSDSIRISTLSLCIFSLMDIVITAHTGYHLSNTWEVVLDSSKVLGHYVRHYSFFFDLASTIPLDLVVWFSTYAQFAESNNALYRIAELPLLLRLMRLNTMIEYLNLLWRKLEIGAVTRKVINGLLRYALFLHWMACFNYLATVLFKTSHEELQWQSWLFQFKDMPLADRYIKSAFRAVSIGYGASPGYKYAITTADIIMMNINLIGGFCFNIMLITQTMQLSKIVSASVVKYDVMINSLKEYMGHKQLPNYMQVQLITFYDFRFQHSFFRESEILACTSGQLRQEIMLHSCHRLVENVTLFNDLPASLLVRIVTCLRTEIYLANEVILKAGDPGDSMYFIAAGAVAIYSPGGLEVCHLDDGAHFGEIALVMEDEQRVASVVAVETSELYLLDRRCFQRVIEPYPDLLSKIENIALERLELTQMLDERRRRMLEAMRRGSSVGSSYLWESVDGKLRRGS